MRFIVEIGSRPGLKPQAYKRMQVTAGSEEEAKEIAISKMWSPKFQFRTKAMWKVWSCTKVAAKGE